MDYQRSKQQVIEDRILATHRVIADKLVKDPEVIIDKAKSNILRWNKQQGLKSLNWYDQEWMKILDQPLYSVVDVLTGKDERSVHLRSSSPFTGILTARERWAIIKNIVS